MRWIIVALVAASAVALGLLLMRGGTHEEPILAVVDYTAHTGNPEDADGVALVDLNPNSKTFGDIVQKTPIAPGATPHHPFYNRDGSKLYTTALAGERLYRIELHDNRIEAVRPLDTGTCQVGEDLYFSQDGTRYYLTCMGSSEILIFDAQTDQMIGRIAASAPEMPYIKYPHGINASEQLDRMLVTSTVSAALDDPGNSVSVLEFSTGRVLSTIPMAKETGTPSAPVEVLFHPNGRVAYVTGMLDSSLWVLSWDEASRAFEPTLVDDGAPRGESWPLEPLLGPDGNLYVSWAQPGLVRVYSLAKPETPKLLRTLPAEAGAHHVDFSRDGRYVFIHNNMLGLENMDAGTISVVDLKSGQVAGRVTSFRDQGLMPESLLILGGGHHH